MRTRLFSLALLAAGLVAGPATAADEGGGPPEMPRREFCKENPGKCDEARAKRQEFCAANPGKCQEQREKFKAKKAERKEFCAKNPEKCEEQRARMKKKRAELEAQCKADPAKCDEIKAKAREKFKNRRNDRPEDRPGRDD